jgi:hypothetical protein
MKDSVKYLELVKWDVIGKLEKMFNRGQLFLRHDYKIDHKRNPAWSIPWIFTRHSNRDCYLYHEICHPHYGFIHSRCHECWKVVAAPGTLKDLFTVCAAQKEIDLPSKCGVEGQRINSDKLYGAYWYNDSKKQGLKCYEIVKEKLPGIPIILKRACTEFEQELGDSRKWEIPQEQLEIERVLDEVMVKDVHDHDQTYHVRCHIMKQWIHSAFQWGDKTYLEYTDGNPLFRNLVTYHEKE